jgi:hypothetical protein
MSSVSRPAAYTDGSTYPTYVKRCHGHDTSWTDQARCKGLSSDPKSPWYNAWSTEPKTKHRFGDMVVLGEQLIKVGLDLCMHCPVQWDCATWALNVDEPQGTWGMRFEDLRALREIRNPLALIERARLAEVPVQVAVRRLRSQPRTIRA